MKDQWAAKYKCAASKDATKISAPAHKSDAATAEMTIKHSQETAQYSKEKQKSARSKQKITYPDYRPFENFSE